MVLGRGGAEAVPTWRGVLAGTVRPPGGTLRSPPDGKDPGRAGRGQRPAPGGSLPAGVGERGIRAGRDGFRPAAAARAGARAAARRGHHRYPDAAHRDQRGDPGGGLAAREPSGSGRSGAEPVHRPGVRDGAARARLRGPGVPAQGAGGQRGRAGASHPCGRPGRLGDRPARGRRAGEVAAGPAAARPVVADAAGVGDPGRDGAGQEQRRDRRLPQRVGARRGEAHQLDLRQARPVRGKGPQPPGEGGPAVPGRGQGRLTTPAAGGGSTLPRSAGPWEAGGMTTNPYTVVVVDDQAPFRMAAKAVLRRLPGFELAGEASSGPEAIELVDIIHPALVLMDINMPEMNGIEATRRIVSAHPDIVVFLCSTYDVEDLPPGAADSGASAYVNKERFGADTLRRLWADRDSGSFVTA